MARVRTDGTGRQITLDDGVTVRVENRYVTGRNRRGLMPSRWRASVTGGDLDLDLHLRVVDGVVHCTAATASQPAGGGPVTARRLRGIKLDTYIRYSAQLVAKKAAVDLGGGLLRIAPLSLAEREALDRNLGDRGGRRGRELISDDRLREVADAWRQYDGVPNRLSQAARSVNLSRSHFHRMRELAIESGFLDEATVPRRRPREKS